MSERKFSVGDLVKLNHRELAILTGKAKRHSYKGFVYVPDPETLKLIDRRRARRIVRIEYNESQQCSFYFLGSNHRGKADKLSLIAFRSYQLEPVTEPNRIGRPRRKRKYARCQNVKAE